MATVRYYTLAFVGTEDNISMQQNSAISDLLGEITPSWIYFSSSGESAVAVRGICKLMGIEPKNRQPHFFPSGELSYTDTHGFHIEVQGILVAMPEDGKKSEAALRSRRLAQFRESGVTMFIVFWDGRVEIWNEKRGA